MKERPILFSGPMVRAILAGEKTQTRRVLANQNAGEHCSRKDIDWTHSDHAIARPGDRFWVRETWALQTMDPRWSDGAWAACYSGPIADRPSDCETIFRADYDNQFVATAMVNNGRWRPSIFLPRWASRLILEVTSLRVEMVNNISCEDALAEGVEYWLKHGGAQLRAKCSTIPAADTRSIYPHSDFQILWDSINEKRGFGWDRSPYVWVIGFKVIKSPTHSLN